MENDILTRMLQGYRDFTRSEKRIVDYVLGHRREVEHITITDLSRRCNVSISTVSRFCLKIKVKGFSAFKLELVRTALPEETCLELLDEKWRKNSAAVTMQRVHHHMNAELSNAYCKLSESDVMLAADLLQSAKQVVCLGRGSGSIVALAAWAQFSTISSKFKTIQDSYMQIVTLSTLSEKDVVLYFSDSKFDEEILASAKIIQHRGAKLILVTGYLNPLAEAYAEVVLLYGLSERTSQIGATGIIVKQLFVIEILFSKFEYCSLQFMERDGH